MEFLQSLSEFWRNLIVLGAVVFLVLLPLAIIYGDARDARNKFYD